MTKSKVVMASKEESHMKKMEGWGIYLLSVFFAFGFLLVAKADTTYYTLGVDEKSSGSGWIQKNRWTNEVNQTQAAYAPNSGNAAVKSMDFLVTKGYALRTSNDPRYTNCNGRVTIGTLDSPGHILNKSYGGKIVVFQSGLTCVNGTYEAAQSAGDKYDRAYVGGSVTIASPEATPFLFGNVQYSGVTISADISGAAGTKFRMGADINSENGRPTLSMGQESPMILSGDNSGYLGKIEVASGSGNAILAIASETALGGARESFAADTVKLTTQDTGTIAFTNGAPAKLDTANLGITFNGVEGGTVYPRTFAIDVIEGLDVELAVPVAAYGQCSNSRKWLAIKKAGAGTLTWSGEVTFPDGLNSGWPKLAVDAGRIVLASASTIALTNELSSAVWLKSPGAADTALSGWTFSAGGALVFDATSGKTPGAFVLNANCTISNAALPLPIHLAVDNAKDACDICVLKVPTSVKTLSPTDFIDADAADGYAGSFRINTSDGIQSVRLMRGRKGLIVFVQ